MTESSKVVMEAGVACLLARVSQILTERDVRSYLVGGFVRDALLGRATADIDIAVSGDALETAQNMADALGGKYVVLDEVNRVARVVLTEESRPGQLDFSTIEDSIESDLSRRDFTIDAMAVDLQRAYSGDNFSLATDMLIDPFGGQIDLARRVVRVVADAAFGADSLRLLRAVRLAAELGFYIDARTEALIRRDHQLISSVAGERIREELLRLLAIPRAGQAITYLTELELLTTIIPDLERARGVEQPVLHVWDVFHHLLRTVASVEFLLREGKWEFTSESVLDDVPWSAGLSEHFDQEVSTGSTRRSLIKLAALLHDISKPETKSTDENGRVHFLGHAQQGAALAAEILVRLRFSSREIKLVETMVQYHLRPTQLGHDAELPTGRAIYRYFRDTGDAGIDVLFLSLADHLASRGPELDITQWQEHANLVRYVLERYFEGNKPVTVTKLIDGHDIMDVFGLSPGPAIGRLLEEVREAQAAGEVKSRDEVLAYVERLIASGSFQKVKDVR